jgi:two-component system LytT family sensor kinase
MTPTLTGLIVDLLGYLTGTALYVMLVVMVWRERVAERQPLFSRRGRLPLLTGLCGLVWNLGALASFAMQVMGDGRPAPLVVALTFSALGFLPAVVVHSLLEGREAAAGRTFTRSLVFVAYGLSTAAALLHGAAALDHQAVPSRPALWLLTGGFITLMTSLLFVTRQQPFGRRGIWVAALSVFAVSALHFGRHSGNEVWWVDLIGHHASLLLALAILHQDYRFALADLFLKNAIALLLLMGVSMALLSGVIVPVLRWEHSTGALDPRALAICVLLWMATAMIFPALRTLAGRVVDRVVLRRSDYGALLAALAHDLDALEVEASVLARTTEVLQESMGTSDVRRLDDPWPRADQRLVIRGPEVRLLVAEPGAALLLRVATVEEPRLALAVGALAAGRRLLSDDIHFLDGVSRLATRRIDAIRVTQERMEHNLREQRMQRLATEAELRALRAQLNPHFLFNALTTIGHLIQSAPPRAFETLMRLTNVLRGVLRRTATEFSTLGQEIDLITAYLDVERARFEERLQVTVDVSPAARDCQIPSLLLQPLVENAVKHGIGPLAAGGAIHIVADVRQQRLSVRIEDSGGGFDPASTTAIAGVGLANVAQRLRAHYGAGADLRIRSAAGRGTAIELDLPADRTAELHAGPARKRVG